jgi:RNA polymerase sigma-70 factor (ECF subfamily)
MSSPSDAEDALEPDRPEQAAARRAELSGTVVLLGRVQHQGDGEALDRLFARYYPRVLRYVQARTGKLVRSKMEIEDIVQNTFFAAIQDIRSVQVREPGELIHWLATVAENQIRGAVDHWRAAKRNPRLEKPLAAIKSSISSGTFRFEPMAEQESPSDALGKREIYELVNECLGELSEDHRQVLLLRNIAGASWDYVARQMGRETPQAACMLHARAKVALLKVLGLRMKSDPGAT